MKWLSSSELRISVPHQTRFSFHQFCWTVWTCLSHVSVCAGGSTPCVRAWPLRMRWSSLLTKASTVHCAKHTVAAHMVKNSFSSWCQCSADCLISAKTDPPVSLELTCVFVCHLLFICLLEGNWCVCVFQGGQTVLIPPTWLRSSPGSENQVSLDSRFSLYSLHQN